MNLAVRNDNTQRRMCYLLIYLFTPFLLVNILLKQGFPLKESFQLNSLSFHNFYCQELNKLSALKMSVGKEDIATGAEVHI